MLFSGYRFLGRSVIPSLKKCSGFTTTTLHSAQSELEVSATTAAADTSAQSAHVPRRACLYVPGNDLNKLRKIPAFNVDCAILDCEDGVALNRKEEARAGIRQILDELDFGRTEPIVRINSVDSGLAEEDMKAVLQAKRLPPTVMLPKVDHPDHIDWISSHIVSTLKDLKRKTQQTFNIIIFAESPLAMLRLESICMRASELSDLGAPARLCGIVFGSDDYCANIGVERSKTGMELLYARQKLVLIAKAFQLQAIDMVHIDIKDLEGLKQQSLEGAQMGFTGKQVIHPGQIATVQDAFSPSPARVEWATELIKAFDEHQKSGKGAFTFRDHMIDMPLVLQARNIVESMKLLNIHRGTPDEGTPTQGSPGQSQSSPTQTPGPSAQT